MRAVSPRFQFPVVVRSVKFKFVTGRILKRKSLALWRPIFVSVRDDKRSYLPGII